MSFCVIRAMRRNVRQNESSAPSRFVLFNETYNQRVNRGKGEGKKGPISSVRCEFSSGDTSTTRSRSRYESSSAAVRIEFLFLSFFFFFLYGHRRPRSSDAATCCMSRSRMSRERDCLPIRFQYGP